MNLSDTEKTLGLFALALCQTMPPEITRRIADNLNNLGLQAQRDGDTIPGTAATNLASLLRSLAG